MDPRERGVAHVNIFWCLVPLVLMLGAAGYGYMKHVEADEAVQAKKDATTAEARLVQVVAHREQQLKELTGMLGNAEKFKDHITEIANYTPPAEYTTPTALKRAFDTLKSKMGVASSFGTFDEIVNAASIELKAQRDQVAALNKQLTQARTEVSSAQSATDSVRGDLQGQLSAANATIASERQKLDDQVRTGTEQVADAQKKTRTAIEEKEKVTAESNRVIAGKDNEILLLKAANQNKISKLTLINSPDAPDGRVLSSSPSTGLCWVDVGGRDMLKAGINFRILERARKGLRLKGHGTVIRVERDRAQVRITNLVNDRNPIVKNDVIANDLYSRSMKRNIFLVGRFVSPLSKGEIKRILEDMGNVVMDKMSPQVDLVVVGREPLGEDATPIAETEGFLNAQRWNVEIASLNKIRDFLRL